MLRLKPKVFPEALMDEPLEKKQLQLRLTQDDFAVMFAGFTKHDSDNSGSLDIEGTSRPPTAAVAAAAAATAATPTTPHHHHHHHHHHHRHHNRVL